jgi:hypothetical protein
VDVTAELVAPCPPDQLFRWVDDLSRYPDWLDIVPEVAPAEPHPDDPGPAWLVTLRGRLGPFARAKRLRMVRTAHEPPHGVRFERAEHDGRPHPAWVLRAEVGADATQTPEAPSSGPASKLTVRLHYGGSLGGPPVSRLLTEAIEDSRPRLLQCVLDEDTGGRQVR